MRLLQQARSFGEYLVVGLNSDDSVEKIKKRIIRGAEERKFILEALDCVDSVIIFDDVSPLDLITIIKPDILVKGTDYKPEEIIGADFVKSYGGCVEHVPLLPGYSTSNTIKTIRCEH